MTLLCPASQVNWNLDPKTASNRPLPIQHHIIKSSPDTPCAWLRFPTSSPSNIIVIIIVHLVHAPWSLFDEAKLPL